MKKIRTAEETKVRKPLEAFRMPSYSEIPGVGLYLDQTSKYVNECLADLPGCELTSSMISNYVKHDIIPNPVKKLYYRDHIVCLLFIAIVKNSLNLEDIGFIIEMQMQRRDSEESYRYFSESFVSALHDIAGGQGSSFTVSDDPVTALVDRALLASANVICVNDAIERLRADSKNAEIQNET